MSRCLPAQTGCYPCTQERSMQNDSKRVLGRVSRRMMQTILVSHNFTWVIMRGNMEEDEGVCAECVVCDLQ
jgi:hypothetical protein